jgi:hypothetical protein
MRQPTTLSFSWETGCANPITSSRNAMDCKKRKGHADTETQPPRRVQKSVPDINRISVIIIITRNAWIVKYPDGVVAKSRRERPPGGTRIRPGLAPQLPHCWVPRPPLLLASEQEEGEDGATASPRWQPEPTLRSRRGCNSRRRRWAASGRGWDSGRGCDSRTPGAGRP